MNEEIIKPLFGIVVLFDVWRNERTYERRIVEIGRSTVLPYWQALDVYANTANPASQLIKFEDEVQQILAEAKLQADINDPEWLKHLFEQI